MWRSSLFGLFFTATLVARSIPGGGPLPVLPSLQPVAYLGVAPSLVSDGDTYVTSRLSFEDSPGVLLGAVYGKGTQGFHFGVEGKWEVLVEDGLRGWLGLASAYERRSAQAFLALTGSATVARPILFSRSVLTPFAEVQVVPALALGAGLSETGVRPALGVDWELTRQGRLHLWLQYAWGAWNAPSEAVLGVSYPFATAL